jgi:hypothetical protein
VGFIGVKAEMLKYWNAEMGREEEELDVTC